MLFAHLLCSVIKDDWKVLHVVNHEQLFPKATHVLSELSFAERKPSPFWLRDSKERFTENTWSTVSDLCTRTWPYKDNEFDFVICDHSLETLRDPIFVCEELQRVAKKGYIECVAPIVNFVEGIERDGVVGYPHHRWFVNVEKNKLRFAFKNHILQFKKEYHIHKPSWYKGINPLKLSNGLFWKGKFKVEEDKEVSVFPDWYFEELYGNEWNKRPDIFFYANQPIPVLVEGTPFEKNALVLVKELEVKFGVPLYDEHGRPSMDMHKFEAILDQQGKL